MPCARKGQRPIAINEREGQPQAARFALRKGSSPNGRDRDAGAGRSLEPGRTGVDRPGRLMSLVHKAVMESLVFKGIF